MPVGAFLFEYVWTNANAAWGRFHFDHRESLLVEVLVIVLSLTVYSVDNELSPPPESQSRVGSQRLQRLTKWTTLAFVLGHFWEFGVQQAFFGLDSSAFHTTLQAHLSWTHWGVPWLAIGYLIGLAAAAFQLVNGLLAFTDNWGLPSTERTRQRLLYRSIALGAVLFIASALVVVSAATGSHLGPSVDDAPPPAPCNSAAPP